MPAYLTFSLSVECFFYLSIYVSVFLRVLSLCPFLDLSVYLSLCVSICLYNYLCACPSLHVSISRSLSLSLSLHVPLFFPLESISISLPMHLSTYLAVNHSFYLGVCLSTNLFGHRLCIEPRAQCARSKPHRDATFC